jgi:hypothetical protein
MTDNHNKLTRTDIWLVIVLVIVILMAVNK